MALTKITSDVIGTGAVTSDHLASGAVTHSSLSNITTDNVSEGSTNTYFTNARARGSISVTGGNLSYDSGTGVIQLTTDQIRTAVSGGTGVSISAGEISIGQDVATSSTPTFGNITTTGYIAGPATFTIDPAAVGDNTGTVVIAGNLQVDGTTTTINSTTMEVDDLNITLASGAANAAAANGAGITVDGASATITYDGTNDEWDFNKDIKTTGTVNSMTIGASGFTCPTSQNFVINSPNGFRVNIDSNNTGTQENFVVGNNQTDAAANNILFKVNEAGKASIGHGAANANLHIGSANATGDATNPAFQIGGASTYRLGMYTTAEGAIIDNANGDDGIQFRVKTAGEAMRINGGTGSVGIGTSSPLRQLHVNSGTTNVVARFESTDSRAVVEFKDPSGSAELGGIGNDIYFAPAGVEKVRIDSSGNVGIGTTSPTQAFEVHPNDDYQAVIGRARIGDLGYGDFAGFGHYDTGTDYAILQYYTGETYINASSGRTINFRINNATKMVVASSGNVGIGTNSVETELHIKGTNNSAGDLYTQVGPGNCPSITIQNAGTTDNNNAALYFRDDQDMRGSVAMRFTGHSTHSSELRFSTTYANNTREKVFISDQGQIGINKLSGLATGGFGTPMLVIKQISNSQWGGINFEANGNDAIFAIGTTDSSHIITGSYRVSAGYKPIQIGAAGNMTMRFDTNGRISMGDNTYTNFTSPDYPVHICGDSYSLMIESGTGYSHFGSSNTSYFHIVGNRTYYFGQRCEANGGFHTYSDERLKENITPISNALDKVSQMNGITFSWIDAENRGGGDTGKQFGVTAQNMLEVDSELPTLNKDPLASQEEIDNEESTDYYSMDYSRITPFLIEAIKELKTKLEAAEARITELEG